MLDIWNFKYNVFISDAIHETHISTLFSKVGSFVIKKMGTLLVPIDDNYD